LCAKDLVLKFSA